MSVSRPVESYPRNAPGPFYVANGGCITCLAPEHGAQDLMGFDEATTHCYFKTEPTTPEELERATRAVWVSCCGAVQYSGDEARVHRPLLELAEEGLRRREGKPWWRFW